MLSEQVAGIMGPTADIMISSKIYMCSLNKIRVKIFLYTLYTSKGVVDHPEYGIICIRRS